MTDREGPIHKAILHYLRAQFPGALIFHPANELNLRADPKTKAIAQARAKALGMLPGAPDIVMLCDGVFWGFEVKAAKGKASEHQERVGQIIRQNGGRWAIVRSIDDVVAEMKGPSEA